RAELLLPGPRRQTEPAGPEPVPIPPAGRGGGRRYMDVSPPKGRLLGLVPAVHQGRGAGGRGGRGGAANRTFPGREPGTAQAGRRALLHLAGFGPPAHAPDRRGADQVPGVEPVAPPSAMRV